jgi:voltage-gated potassium channel
MVDTALGKGKRQPRAQAADSLRHRAYRQLDPTGHHIEGLSLVNRLVVFAILTDTVLAILETEAVLHHAWGQFFTIARLSFGSLFAVEYLARLWTSPERHPDKPAWRCRLAFIIAPAGIADLAAVVASLLPHGGEAAALLRWLRLARIVRLARLGRMSWAMDYVIAAIASRREELFVCVIAGTMLVVSAATALYIVEGQAQPEAFGSILRSLWWAVATMTTVGYGDVYPITVAGKVLAGIVAILSVGLIAMPTGILAAAFSDAMARHRAERDASKKQSPGA